MEIKTSLISRVVSAVVALALSAGLLTAGQQSATPTVKPHPTPHPHPTPTPTPMPSATPMAAPGSDVVVTFEDKNQNDILSGTTYGGIVWQSGLPNWKIWDGTRQGFTKNVYINSTSTSAVSRTFTLPAGDVLKSLKIGNGAGFNVNETVTIQSSGNPTRTYTDITQSYQTKTLGWTTASSTVTITVTCSGSYGASSIVFDNLTYGPLSATPTATPSATPTPSNNTFLTSLYAYYKLDETNGNAVDASDNGKTLSNFGDFIGTSTGIINSSRDFDGVSGTTLIRNANTTDFFCGANPFSFSFWVKFDTFPSFNDVGLCNRYEPYGRREYIVFLSKATNKITFNIDAGDGVHAVAVRWGTPVSTGVWYHVAGGWDGAQIKLSVNAGPFVTAAYSTPMRNGGDNFKLGYEAQSLDGKMDEFGFWIARCLTQTEVGQLYNNGAGLPFSSFR
jgi:hypothetical protein